MDGIFAADLQEIEADVFARCATALVLKELYCFDHGDGYCATKASVVSNPISIPFFIVDALSEEELGATTTLGDICTDARCLTVGSHGVANVAAILTFWGSRFDLFSAYAFSTGNSPEALIATTWGELASMDNLRAWLVGELETIAEGSRIWVDMPMATRLSLALDELDFVKDW